MPETFFQVKLAGEWKNYDVAQHKILMRAYLAGFPNARYDSRGHKYEVNFKDMLQKNVSTGKAREIRPPHRVRAPPAPIVPAGKTICITVPPGSAGKEIMVPHPRAPGQMVTVAVPATAKVGQSMLVPLPDVSMMPADGAPQWPSQGPMAPSAPPPPPAGGAPPAVAAPPADAAAPADAETKSKGMSTGAKVAAVGGGVALAGGVAVAGAVLGEHIAEDGWDGFGDAAGDVGEGIADAAVDAGEWIGDTAETAADFIMDLF